MRSPVDRMEPWSMPVFRNLAEKTGREAKKEAASR